MTPNSDELAQKIRDCLNSEKLQPRGQRILQYLLIHRVASTGCLAFNCACGNVPDAIAKMEKVLSLHELAINKLSPVKGARNRFGEPSQVHRWEVVELDA